MASGRIGILIKRAILAWSRNKPATVRPQPICSNSKPPWKASSASWDFSISTRHPRTHSVVSFSTAVLCHWQFDLSELGYAYEYCDGENARKTRGQAGKGGPPQGCAQVQNCGGGSGAGTRLRK